MEMICHKNEPNIDICQSIELMASSNSSPEQFTETLQYLRNTDIIDNDMASDATDEEVIVPESPPNTPHSHICEDRATMDNETDSFDRGLSEVPMTQMADNNSDNNINARNSLRRQTSICVNMTSSPRAIAIFRNAIKSKSDLIVRDNNALPMQCTQDIHNNDSNCSPKTVNQNSSPTIEFSNKRSLNCSPFSRGSAFLRAAKQRITKENVMSNTSNNNHNNDNKEQILQTDSLDNETKALTSILRKHELESSPTTGEPKFKKKKVLFAEPVVSSEREFECSPFSRTQSIRPFRSIFNDLKSYDMPINSTTTRKRSNLIHQDSTFHDFDVICDSNDDDTNDGISPPLLTQLFSDSPLDDKEDSYFLEDCISDDTTISENSVELEFNVSHNLNLDTDSIHESETPSDERIPCSQPLPAVESAEDDAKNNDQKFEPFNANETPINSTEDEDIIVNVPMRLSLIRELYNLFGQKLLEYS